MATEFLTPAKVKAFLTNIKATVLDEDRHSSGLADSYLLLLRMEVLQRGVFFAINNEDENNGDTKTVTKKLLEVVRSTAGKSLLNEQSSSLPKPLLAGSAAVAGRIAEKAAAAAETESATPQNNDRRKKWIDTLFDRTELKLTLDRCKEVQDERFQGLLRLGKEYADLASTVFQRRLLYIAESFYYRAASFQPDVPPMWKRAWDVISEGRRIVLSSNHTTTDELSRPIPTSWEATTSLTNLHRIASSKGNVKRAAELSLILAQSFLDEDNLSSQVSDEGTKSIIQIFVKKYRPTERPSRKESATGAAHALADKSLKEADLSSENSFLLILLAFRVELAQETATVEEAAQNAFERKKNRANEGGKANNIVPPLETFRLKSKQSCLVASSCDSPLETSAAALVDALLNKSREDHSSSESGSNDDSLIGSAYLLLSRFLHRQKDKARAIAMAARKENKNETRGWTALASTLETLFSSWHGKTDLENTPSISQDGSDRSIMVKTFFDTMATTDERQIVETACTLVPCVEWMCCGTSLDHERFFSVGRLQFVCDILEVFHEEARIQNKNQASSGVVKTGVRASEKRLLTLDCALSSTRAFLVLSSENSKAQGNRIAAAALVRAEKSGQYGDLGSEFGFPFLDFLICWSGLNQPPWQDCVISEARTLTKNAQSCIKQATKDWGRPVSPIEDLLLNLGLADAEGTSFAGGLLSDAGKLYNRVLEAAGNVEENNWASPALLGILRARCYAGLCRVALRSQDDSICSLLGEDISPQDLARKSLDAVQCVNNTDSQPLHMWKAADSAIHFQMAVSRQLVADALLRDGKAKEAQTFLEDAVLDAPLDFGAAFALGAFRLRMLFFGRDRPHGADKAAQIQLLKAAKLDSTKADPFALLGYWYEYFKDTKRAVGCYSKALLIDPSHPVAGRGLIRLKPPDDIKNVLTNAIETNSSLNGWAWRAVGFQKAMVEGSDDLAVVSLVKALRCRDIEHPEDEPAALFFSSPFDPKLPSRDEMADALSDLGLCYRRLGRYTAAIRSFHSAIEAGEAHSGSVLCACAQVELELGLFDEAADKFSQALECGSEDIHLVAVYGRGLALLSMAQRDAEDGKAGSAFAYAQQAAQACHDLGDCRNIACVQKLMGDLHSFGATLPCDVFEASPADDPTCGFDYLEGQVRSQLAFVSAGEAAYAAAEKAVVASNKEENNILRACFATDLGSNILSQAQLLAFWDSRGTGRALSVEVATIFHRASKEFRRALELSPSYSPAWCGLGCALATSDPLLAQHAFCRSLELDHLFPDAYANLSFLYTECSAFVPSANVSDALTQVADTPMMWINRAFLLERQAAQATATNLQESTQQRGHYMNHIRQAADAYRAALQVTRQPSAMLGLAMTCRITREDVGSNSIVGKHKADAKWAQKESCYSLSEYVGSLGRPDMVAQVLNGIAITESGALQDQNLIDVGQQLVRAGLDNLEKVQSSNRPAENNLNLQTIRASLDVPMGSKLESILSADSSDYCSLPRRIIHEPNRADLWVALTKKMSLSISSTSSQRELASCLAAARRASRMLQQQLSEPHYLKNGSSSSLVVDAEDLSDALALQFWMEKNSNPQIQERVGGSQEKNEEDDEEKADDYDTNTELQRSLIICPGNRLARELLHASAS